MQQSQNVYINSDSRKVNLNTASREELKSLPNIDNKRADAIIGGRPYRSIYDLRSIHGFGMETIHNLENLIECGGD
jgi:competence protein ComEA